MKILLATIIALIAFAGNSVLCRLALGDDNIDAASFTIIRLLSGALVLFFILSIKHASQLSNTNARGSWKASFMLFCYAASFSFAYISLDTGTGALILFAMVQMTMIAWSLLSGERLFPLEWSGVIIAFAGLSYLLFPGATAPLYLGFL